MPTIREVADLAGVAVGTVSHVVNGSVPVSEALRRKVQDAIRELDYHPNHVARSLKTSKTRTLGIIVPDMTITFFPQVIRGAETAARQRGYSLMAVNSAACGRGSAGNRGGPHAGEPDLTDDRRWNASGVSRPDSRPGSGGFGLSAR
jgi:Bacterial regulatory proteins, lacI family